MDADGPVYLEVQGADLRIVCRGAEGHPVGLPHEMWEVHDANPVWRIGPFYLAQGGMVELPGERLVDLLLLLARDLLPTGTIEDLTRWVIDGTEDVTPYKYRDGVETPLSVWARELAERLESHEARTPA